MLGTVMKALIIIPKAKYLPPKAKSHIWNPKTEVEIEVAILGFHSMGSGLWGEGRLLEGGIYWVFYARLYFHIFIKTTLIFF